jgi:predicted DNA-binding protein YlxM (UPF0122 family)
MGAVGIDLHRNEREFQGLTLSDSNVVKYLILFRSKVDVGYGASTNININQAGDTFEFNQEIIALYTSLDVILKKCKMTKKQESTLKYLFDGHTIGDIAEYYKVNRVSAYRVLDRIVDKIVEKNDEDWKNAMVKQGYIE